MEYGLYQDLPRAEESLVSLEDLPVTLDGEISGRIILHDGLHNLGETSMPLILALAHRRLRDLFIMLGDGDVPLVEGPLHLHVDLLAAVNRVGKGLFRLELAIQRNEFILLKISKSFSMPTSKHLY